MGNPKEIVKEVDYYFNSPVRDFSKTDEALRVRLSEGPDGKKEIEITYKGPKIDFRTKTREEITIKLSNNVPVESVMILFEKLDFKLVGIIEKIREIYIGDFGMRIYLDNVSGIINGKRVYLGYFIEVEILGEYSEENVRRVLNYIKKLGCTKTIRESYLELLIKASKGDVSWWTEH